MDTGYIPRLLDAHLRRGLESAPAVVIEGPRACGKTELAAQQARSTIFLDDTSPASVLAATQPASALTGQTPRLLDEWNVCPGLWNEVRHEVDRRRRPGQFILTGSAAPDVKTARHSGAGRFERLRLSTMTLLERGLSNGTFSLAALFAGTQVPGEGAQATVEQYAQWIVAGGWPGFPAAKPADAARRVDAYLADLVEHDFPEVAGLRRDPRRFRAFLRAYAGLVAQPASFAAISRRLGEEFAPGISPETVGILHDFAARLFIITDQPAFSAKLRSASQPIQTPKRHLADPSLAASLLGASPARLLGDLETLGLLFESLVVHDLRVYAQASLGATLCHLRDRKARDEIDAIIEGPDGNWVGVEVKLSHQAVDAAAANLLRVAGKITPQPTALVVVIASGPVFQRSDGVWVAPAAALAP